MRQIRLITGFLGVLLVLGSCMAGPGGGAARPPANPATIEISVGPDGLQAGSDAVVTLRLRPIEGVQINRYPKIKLAVPAQEGLVEAAEVAIGNASPPPPDKMDTNYFTEVDPVELKLPVLAGAPAGKHEIEGKLTYFYCVKASGFCAPKRLNVTIPLVLR